MAEISRIIYLMQVPMSAREYVRFGAELYASQGLAVEVWNCTPFMNPGYVTAEEPVVAFCRDMTNGREVCAALQELTAQDVVINLLPRHACTLNIHKALGQSAAQDVIVRANALPLLGKSFGQRLRKLNASKLIDFIISRPRIWEALAPKPSRIIYGGIACCPAPGETARSISAHALDYDLFLQAVPIATREPIAVFLDQCFPFHPDFKVIKSEAPVTAERYYPSLCRFFDALEQAYGLEVVIAAHPRSPRDKDLFAGRETVYGQSLELTQRASLVLGHTSTAVNFAVMYQTPLLFLNTAELSLSQGAIIAKLAEQLNAPQLNIDDLPPNWAATLDATSVSHQAYAAYATQYIKTPDSPKLPFWQILLNDLRSQSAQELKP
jgi:hypothetical protein